MMSAGATCRLHRWQAVNVWCVCQRQTCKPVAGFPCRLWATMPCWLFGGLAGFPVALQVPASTLMLIGGNVSGIVSSVKAACIMSAGSACRLHRWQAVKVWCVCQRPTCKAVAGFPCRLWATMPCRLFGRLAGLSCGSSSASLNAHADGAAMCPAWCQVLRLLASCRLVASIGGGVACDYIQRNKQRF